MKRVQQLILTLLTLISITLHVRAQNLNGEKIQVANDALTVLKFNSEIKRYELGDRDGYACQVRDNDNSIVIKTLQEKPSTTNLVVTEGKRTHYFVINFLPKIDLNNTRLYYDYSDLKTLRKLVENEQLLALSTSNNKAEENSEQTKEDTKEPEKKETAKERKRKEKEAQKLAEEEQKQQALEKQQLLAQQKQEQEKLKEQEQKEQQAKEKAKQEQQQKEKEKREQQELAKQKKEQEQKEKLAREQAKMQQQKEQQAKIAAENEAERQRKAAEEEARIKKIADAKEAAKAAEKEQQRLAAEKKKQEAETKRLEAEQQKKLAIEKEQERKEQERLEKIVKQQEEARKKEEAEKARLAAEAAKTEYSHTELWKKYPKIVFGDPPDGQHIAGEYYLPEDTLANYQITQLLLAKEPWLNNSSEQQNDITIVLQSMVFSGVNCYMRFLVKNDSKKDFLVGKMNLNWNKETQSGIDLYPCYVTGYPVVLPGKEKTVVYASRAVNASAGDTFTFSMKDRLLTTNLFVKITGADYNLEMKR